MGTNLPWSDERFRSEVSPQRAGLARNDPCRWDGFRSRRIANRGSELDENVYGERRSGCDCSTGCNRVLQDKEAGNGWIDNYLDMSAGPSTIVYIQVSSSVKIILALPQDLFSHDQSEQHPTRPT